MRRDFFNGLLVCSDLPCASQRHAQFPQLLAKIADLMLAIKKRSLIHGTSWYFLEKFARMIGAFFVGAWTARYLGPEQYGALSYALALTATLSFLSSWGVGSLVIRDLVQQPERSIQIVSTYFWIRLVGSLLAPVLASLALHLTHPGDATLWQITLILTLGISISAFEVGDCWLQARSDSQKTSLIRISGFLLSTAVKVALILSQAGLIWFAIANIAESIFVAVSYIKTLRINKVSISIKYWNSKEFERMFIKSKSMIFSSLAVVVYSKIDLLMVGGILDKGSLGIYAMASSLCAAWNMIGMAISQSYGPHISSLHHCGNKKQYFDALRQFMLVMLAVSTVGSMVLSLMSSWFLNLILGPAYGQTSHIFSILIWSSIPVYLGVASSQVIVNERIYWVSMLRTGLGMAVSLILIIPAIQAFGLEGAASLVICSAAIATVSIFFSHTARKVVRSTFSLR